MLTLCYEPRDGLRARRGRGQHRGPTCERCREVAALWAAVLDKCDDEYELATTGELALSC